jgi:glycogen synthase
MLSMRKYMMQINHSWDKTVDEYTAVYQSLL